MASVHAVPFNHARPQAGLGWWADVALGLLVVVWMSEALVRLPHQSLLTASVYALAAVRLAVGAPVWLPALVRGWPVLLFPAVCAASAAWSEVPVASFVAAAQLGVTVLLGLYLGARFGLAGLAGLVVTGLGLSLAASAVNLAGLWPPAWSWEGGFLGVYTNKNALGQRAALLALTLLPFLAQARGAARIRWTAALAGVVALLALSLSVTALVLAAGACGALALWGYVSSPAAARLAVLVVLLTGLAALGAWCLMMGIDPTAALFEAFGKSHTLTGRTLIWQQAAAQIGQAPALGTGYMAYWLAPDHAQAAQLMAVLYGNSVASFHNFVLEILVATGPLGLAAMAALLGHVGLRLAAAPAGPLRRWAMVTAAVLVTLSLLGSSLYRPHEITIMLIVALGAAAARPPPGSPAPPAARAAAGTARRGRG